MRYSGAFLFWLGRLDTQVVTGRVPSGTGTRDIRFCSVGEALRRFLQAEPGPDGRWTIELEPYPQAHIPQWPMQIAEYSFRGRECAIPGQAPNSTRPFPAYPLWHRVVTLLPRGARPTHCIVLFRDLDGGFHARVLAEAHVTMMPDPLRTELEQRDQCGRLVDLSDVDEDFLDLPLLGPHYAEVPMVPVPSAESGPDWLERIARLASPLKRREAQVRRRSRSRRLAEELKLRYQYRCQLCEEHTRAIDMGNGRFYVEVHHIRGIAETEAGQYRSQDEGHYDLDSHRNIVVVCPYHHMLLHNYKSPISFDRSALRFVSEDASLELPLQLNEHL